MATRSTKASPQELDEADRLRIGHAREVLQEYGLYVDVAEMSDVAYEKRVCRMKALDIAVQTRGPGMGSDVLDRAQTIEHYIWEGKVPDGTL